MKRIILSIIGCCFIQFLSYAQTSKSKIDSILPVRGLAIAAPRLLEYIAQPFGGVSEHRQSR